MMFDGMQYLPLIGIGLGLAVFLACSALAHVILRKMFRGRRVPLRRLSVVLGAAPLIAIIYWLTCRDAPLPLPREAKEVRISRTLPFALAIDDNMRFRIGPTDFRLWVESLCGRSWGELESDSSEVQIAAFTEGQAPTRFGTAPWMDTRSAKRGWLVGPGRCFYGQILYDADRELVYYHFWD